MDKKQLRTELANLMSDLINKLEPAVESFGKYFDFLTDNIDNAEVIEELIYEDGDTELEKLAEKLDKLMETFDV